MRIVGTLFLSSILVFVSSTDRLAAQTRTTGALEGRVVAENGAPVAGATVTVTGAFPGSRIVQAEGSGVFHVAALPPGSYQVAVTATGFAQLERPGAVALGATTTVDFTLRSEAAAEVTVRAEAPLIDLSATAVGTTVDAGAFTRLPLPRDYTSIALFQPGVTADGAGFSVFGATGLENSYNLDGVDITGIRTGAQIKVIPEEFIQEVEVETGNFPAEYGRGLGGIVNAVTRSGGNEFRGEAFGYFDDKSLQANAKPGVVGNNFAGFTDQDYGASLGGYAVRDKLWFFGVYDRTSLSRDVRLETGSGSPFDGTTFRSQDRQQDLYAAKLTWNVTSSTNVVGSLVGGPSKDSQQLVEDGPPATRKVEETTGLPDLSLIGTAVGGRWVGELGLFEHREKLDRQPGFSPPFLTTDDNQVPTLNLADCNLPGCYTGAPWVFIPQGDAPLLDESYRRRQGRGSLTGYLGDHQVKAGVDLADLSGDVFQSIPGGYDRVISRTADGFTLYTQSWFGDESGQFGTDHVVPTVSGHPKTGNTAVFAQDTWTVRSNLTVNVGVRYDAFRLKDAVTGGTITNLQDNWAPRLGLAWDPQGDGRSKVSFAYGRFFQAIPLDHQSNAFAGTNLSITDVAGFTFDCGPTSVACQSFPNRATEPADPHLKAPQSEEITLGYKKSLGGGLTVNAQAIYSRLIRGLEDRCDVSGNDAALAFTGNGCVLMNPGSGDFGKGIFPDFHFADGTSSPILCTNGFNPEEGRSAVPCAALPAAKRLYRALSLSAEERFSSRSYLLASYVRSSLRGNYDGPFNELGEGSPFTNFDFDYPGLLNHAYGRLSNDRPDQAKITGFYRFPGGITAGVNAYYRSGTPEDKIGSFALSNGAPIPLYLAPRGSQGRTPADYDLDLHADYALPIQRLQADLIVDLFRVLDRQAVLRTNPFYNLDGFQSDNGVQTNPNYGAPILRADPRLLRVGLRLSI